MPIRFDRRNKRWRFEFDRYIPGAGRQRASRLLPKTWTKDDAHRFDLAETARLYRLATGVEQAQAKLIDDAVLVYLREKTALKNHANIEAELARCFEAYAGRSIMDLADVAREYAAWQAGNIAPATIRNRLAYLRAACRYAWRHHGMCEHDPAGRLVMPAVNNQRMVHLDRAQMLAIAAAVPNRQARAAIRVAFYSGMREAEILRARVLDGCFVLDDTKNGQPRRIPVHPRIAGITRTMWPLRITGWTISHHFTRANRAAGMPGAVFHSLRHSTASQMINAGVDLNTVGVVLGHKSPASTRRYAHLETQAQRVALGLVGQKVPHITRSKSA